MKKKHNYGALLDTGYSPLIEGDDNPANIPDGTPCRKALTLAKAWMREQGVSEAKLGDNNMESDDIIEVYEIKI